MSANPKSQPRVRFEGMNPILRVKNVEESVAYYTEVLGFQVDFNMGVFASVSRDECHLFLSDGDQGHVGSWVYVGVENVGGLFAEYQQSGAKIRHMPTNYSWAHEMQIEDLDGNILRMGSEPLADEPIGEWLDMDGIAWVPLADGGWTRKP
jgi:catechol 2,3-dioxygenase-like lactoylglutathione lyase family enzyme